MEEDNSLQARLAAYLEYCRGQRTTLQATSEDHERKAVTAWQHHRDEDSREHRRLSVFYAAQACAYRDVALNLERLLGVE